MTTLGPDLPPPDEPIGVEAFRSRWPTGAEKSELSHGVLQFTGPFDERDVEIAQRTYPGRQVLLNEDRGLEVHPASDGPPQTLYERYYKDRSPKRGFVRAEADQRGQTSPELEQR